MARYCTQANVETWFHSNNVLKWSQMGNDSASIDSDKVTACLEEADRLIDDHFRGGPFTVPLPVDDTTTHWAVILAAVAMYSARGLLDEDSEGNKLTVLRDEVMEEMRMTRVSPMRQSDWPRNGVQPSAPFGY